MKKQGAPIEILLVEDNPADIQFAKRALREAGVQNNLHVVTDGEEAIRFLEKEGDEYEKTPTPDLVLLDLKLPKMDGIDVLAEMRHDPDLVQIPVAILTTSEEKEHIKTTYKLDALCYITKPLDLKQILYVVQKIDDFWIRVVRVEDEEPPVKTKKKASGGKGRPTG